MKLIIRYFNDDGVIPNSLLPVIIYKAFTEKQDAESPGYWEDLLERSGWGGGWRNGLLTYHHYHSTAHEILCVYRGWADALIGGEAGEVFRLNTGDAVLLPAGTGHRNMGQSADFSVVGSYPDGQHPDMNYGRLGERPSANERIAAVAVPGMDPLLAASGGINEHWKSG